MCGANYTASINTAAAAAITCTQIANRNTLNCLRNAKDTGTTNSICTQCMSGMWPLKKTGAVEACATVNGAATNAAPTKCQESTSATVCKICLRGQVTTTTGGVCTTAPAGNEDCQIVDTNSKCMQCRDGCFMNGWKCQCTALAQPAPSPNNWCMETNTDGTCTRCFNDGGATESFRSLSAANGNCTTKSVAADLLSTALYSDGNKVAGANDTATSFYCKKGETFHFNTTDKTKRECKALSSGDIANCHYQAKNLGTSAVTCTMCSDGYKPNAGLTTCTADPAASTNNVKNWADATNVHECKSGYINQDNSCVTWANNTSNDQNCRKRTVWTWGAAADTTTVCIACKWGYYFAGGWCVAGHRSGSTSTASSTSSSTTASSTTAAKSGFLNIFAAGFALMITALFN